MSMEAPRDGEQAAAQPDELLCFAIYSTGLAFSRFYKSLLHDLGLTYPQYLVMIALWAQDGRTVTDLGRQVFLESNTLTPLLKRLESTGWLVRRRDAADERKVRLWLTAQGRERQAKADDIRRCITVVAGMPDDELDDLRDKVLALRDALGTHKAP